MLTAAMVAIETSIVATSVASIVDDLGGFTEFPWLFSGYLLAQAVSVPVYGRLSDLYGRKTIMMWGLGVFTVGSLLCALSWSMAALVVFRVVQGFGAGAVQPMSQTIAGDIYTVAERARIQGYLAGVWGTAVLVGPSLGGLLSAHVSWRATFLVAIPGCLLAAWLLSRHFVEDQDFAGEVSGRRTVDYTGAILLSSGSALLILGLLEGGDSWAWRSPIGAGVLGAAVALLIVFVWVERRVPDPILPLRVLARRIVVAACLISLFRGAVAIGLTGYVPTFIQEVLGTGPARAGFALAALSVGWPIASALAGRLYMRHGFRAAVLVGAVTTVVGAVLASRLTVHSELWHVIGACLVIGTGMGLIGGPTLIAAQSSVGWAERGVVTSTSAFAVSIGSAVGVAVFGAVVNARLGMVDAPEPGDLADAVHLVFVVMLGAAIVMTVAGTVLPGGRTDRTPA
nr:MFS transporter [Prescottella subtropica]